MTLKRVSFFQENSILNFVGSLIFNTISAEKNQAREKPAFDDFYVSVVYFISHSLYLSKFDIQIYLIHVVYTTCVINLCIIKRVMLHHMLPVIEHNINTST